MKNTITFKIFNEDSSLIATEINEKLIDDFSGPYQIEILQQEFIEESISEILVKYPNINIKSFKIIATENISLQQFFENPDSDNFFPDMEFELITNSN